ncbi:aldo/keto reductase [Gordonia sp. L191]|uniref:aldo/keto reductase n=1 Tax=Gordonia sp. L191 TaxID=2982699 RepID=UPI0024BFA521|nr:aldo/keto reductase [Gordonia sp. L191]WHU49305.1 aldo/keto reductase [Gordonia sp. L191]
MGENSVVIDIARDLDVSPAQVGLAWLLAHSPNTLLIPGTSDIRHLDANLAVRDITLNPESVTTLDALGAATTTAPIEAPRWPAEAR